MLKVEITRRSPGPLSLGTDLTLLRDNFSNMGLGLLNLKLELDSTE
jgi:hypothetical protein